MHSLEVNFQDVGFTFIFKKMTGLIFFVNYSCEQVRESKTV